MIDNKFVFENEEGFLARFFPKYEDVEISSFYMAGSRCYVRINSCENFRNRESTIRTDAVVNWVNELSTERGNRK